MISIFNVEFFGAFHKKHTGQVKREVWLTRFNNIDIACLVRRSTAKTSKAQRFDEANRLIWTRRNSRDPTWIWRRTQPARRQNEKRQRKGLRCWLDGKGKKRQPRSRSAGVARVAPNGQISTGGAAGDTSIDHAPKYPSCVPLNYSALCRIARAISIIIIPRRRAVSVTRAY